MSFYKDGDLNLFSPVADSDNTPTNILRKCLKRNTKKEPLQLLTCFQIVEITAHELSRGMHNWQATKGKWPKLALT